MLEYGKCVIATGRFQIIHYGSLAYLKAAKTFADENDYLFCILTGPTNSELSVHGHKDSGAHSRLLCFEERRLLISLLLKQPSDLILNNCSSPHHGETGLTKWANEFLAPLEKEHGQYSKQLRDCVARKSLILTTVVKKNDIKIYKPKDTAYHYTYYLQKRYPWMEIVDIGSKINENLDISIGASDLNKEIELISDCLPPAMLAAEILRNTNIDFSFGEPKQILLSVQEEFGFKPISYKQVLGYIEKLQPKLAKNTSQNSEL